MLFIFLSFNSDLSTTIHAAQRFEVNRCQRKYACACAGSREPNNRNQLGSTLA